MRPGKEPLIGAAVLILVGVGSLLNSLHLLPQVDWVWTLGLALGGVLILVCSRINRASFVLGMSLLVGAVFSLLRQTGKLNVEQEVPCLLIAVGLLIVSSYCIPAPKRSA
jgi:hypothetical protein